MNDKNDAVTYKLSEEELALASGGKMQHWEEDRQKPTGIPCPNCGKFIPTTITELLTQGYLRCPYCLMKIKIDK